MLTLKNIKKLKKFRRKILPVFYTFFFVLNLIFNDLLFFHRKIN